MPAIFTACNTKNLAGLVALYDANAVLMPPTGERIVGKEKITDYFKQIFASASRLTINLTSDETDTSGDLGFDSGQYEETIPTAGGGVVVAGPTVTAGPVVKTGG